MSVRGHAGAPVPLRTVAAARPHRVVTHAPVGMAHAHHWDVAYAAFPLAMRAITPNLEHPWPRYAALVDSWELLAELGLID